MRGRGADEAVLCVVASWAYGLVKGVDSDKLASEAAALGAVERYIRGRLAADQDSAADFPTISAALSMEKAHAEGLPYSDGPLDAKTLLELRRAEMNVLFQRRTFKEEMRREQAQRVNLSAPSQPLEGAVSMYASVRQAVIPVLEIRAFGRFDVSIGGELLDPTCLGRRHTQALLVLLAANRGRDLSRDAVASSMWPDCSIEAARKNFYTVWSQLRRGLTLTDGTCPYLIRHQFGCRLDDRFVRSDIGRLDDICRELLFGRLDFELWLELYTEIDKDFSSELLPMEKTNALVAKTRDDCRRRLVDALVAATQRLIDAGNPEWGIWFARTALVHEPLREDAYVALMRAQIAHNQRTAAMMTYLQCKRVLADELGIDPSPETTALYDSLLDS